MWLTQTVLTRALQNFVVGQMTSSSASNFTSLYEAGKQTSRVANTYSISGTLCTPKDGAKDKEHIQYLIHGVGFDSRCIIFLVS